MKFNGHRDEGYAIDWSPLVTGRLISGDCKSSIHLWEPASGSWNVDCNPYVGHEASVEDLQWSPVEDFVFASCSVDGHIAIWDIRQGKSPAKSIKAHKADVNVISWNRIETYLLASGCGDGTFCIRDLRKGQKELKEVHWHSQIPGMIISTAADGFNILMPSNLEPLPPA